MPQKLSDAARKNKATYDKKYQAENVTRKSIFFNKGNPEDLEMLEWLKEKGERRISGYVKGLIRDDMNKAGK